MLEKQLEIIKAHTDFVPDIAIVLGSGLGDLADKIDIKGKIPYEEIDGMPTATTSTHIGQFVYGYLGDKKIVMMQGRVHMYEGYTSQEVVMPIRLMHKWGAKTLILTNASGGINKEYKVGEFMLMSDHISLFVPSPLIGKNDDTLGPRHPDMSAAYDKALQRTAIKVAMDNDIVLHRGVYAQLMGPQFESPSEIRALSTLGADTVGMSTVIEAIAANHCGMSVCGISLITNYACGILDQPLSGEEVCETANSVAPKFETLIKEIVKAI